MVNSLDPFQWLFYSISIPSSLLTILLVFIKKNRNQEITPSLSHQKIWISTFSMVTLEKGCLSDNHFFPYYIIYTSLSTFSAAAAAKSLQLCLTLCDPIDGSPPGSPVPGILQARTLEWVAFPSPMHESEVAQSCPTLGDPVDCSPPGSSVHGIFQARGLEWGAITFSRPTFSRRVLIWELPAVRKTVMSMQPNTLVKVTYCYWAPERWLMYQR